METIFAQSGVPVIGKLGIHLSRSLNPTQTGFVYKHGVEFRYTQTYTSRFHADDAAVILGALFFLQPHWKQGVLVIANMLTWSAKFWHGTIQAIFKQGYMLYIKNSNISTPSCSHFSAGL